MPKYYFHVGGAVSRPDLDGVEFHGTTDAWDEALLYAGDLKTELDGSSAGRDWHITVVGPDGSFLFRFDFKAAS